MATAFFKFQGGKVPPIFEDSRTILLPWQSVWVKYVATFVWHSLISETKRNLLQFVKGSVISVFNKKTPQKLTHSLVSSESRYPRVHISSNIQRLVNIVQSWHNTEISASMSPLTAGSNDRTRWNSKHTLDTLTLLYTRVIEADIKPNESG